MRVLVANQETNETQTIAGQGGTNKIVTTDTREE
jgi:hypothetical protein